MQKKKFLALAGICSVALTVLASCASGDDIQIWVGNESVAYYKSVIAKYKEENPDFNYNVEVIGTDTGSNGGVMVDDNTACGDIVTVAHDNIGKLSQGYYIKPLLDEELVAQIKHDNSADFVNAVTNTFGPREYGLEFLFASPYISQALVLYYNKAYVTEEQARTFEGLAEAARQAKETLNKDVRGFMVTGTDAYNYSFNVLARRAADNYSSLQLYEGGEITNCYAQGEDELASLQWAQRIFNDGYTGKFPGSSSWNQELENKTVLSVISGAWNFNAFVTSVGEQNVGIAKLPTYTLTAEDVRGIDSTKESAVAAGDVMQAGSFADCKAFVINSASADYKYKDLQALVKYLSSVEVQNGSFVEAGNIPAYSGAEDFIRQAYAEGKVESNLYNLAVSQNEMARYGMPQPFADGIMNAFFYTKSTDTMYKNAILNQTAGQDYTTTEQLRSVLYRMERIWKFGVDPGYGKLPTTK